MIAQQLVASLASLASTGVAMLLVEQDPNLIEAAVSRVYLLSRGTMVASGPLHDLGGLAAVRDLYLGLPHRHPA